MPRDNVAAASTATGHLIGLGRRRIAFIGGRQDRKGDIPYDRAAGYRAALAQAGHPAPRQLEVSAPRGTSPDRRILTID